jgi:hypothetical protein
MRVALCLIALSTFSAADDKPTIAVLGVVPTDTSLVAKANTLTQTMRTLANAKSSPYRVKGAPKQIEAAIRTAECSTIQTPCAAALGAELDTDYALVGQLDKRGTHAVLLLALVDVRTKQRVRSLRETSAVDAKKWARATYNRLVDTEAGELALAANAQNGEVWIDGQLAGALYQGRVTITGLANGTHQLSVRAKGYKQLDVDITVEFATKHSVLLEPQ